MPGTSTIPTIASGATSHIISISWIDAENAEFTAAFKSISAPTDVQLQALVDASQNLSNASSWKLETRAVYEGTSNSSSASADSYLSSADKIRLSFKDLSNGAYDQNYLPAPLQDAIDPGGTVDTNNVLYQAWRDATIPLVQAGFQPLNVGFVQNVQRNEAVSP